MRRKRVALVLGGGGVKGLAHLGVLRVLEREGIPVDFLVGTSAGAIVGSLYALDPCAERSIERLMEFLGSERFRRYKPVFEFRSDGGNDGRFFRRLIKGIQKQVAMELLFRRPAVFPGNRLYQIVHLLVGDKQFEDLHLPLAVTAVDLRAGHQVVLNRGPLAPAVTASSSVPGFFPPVTIDGLLLADAGVIDNIPVRVAKSLGADVILAVNLNHYMEPLSEFNTGIEVIFRSQEIGTKLVNDLKSPMVDAVITPDLASRFWLDFEDLGSVLQAGEDAALATMPEIHEALGAHEEWEKAPVS